MAENTARLEELISSLQIEIEALQEELWSREDEYNKLHPATTTDVEVGINTQEGQEVLADTTLTPEEQQLIELITSLKSQLTMKQMQLKAYQRRLADVLANTSEYFNKEEVQDAND